MKRGNHMKEFINDIDKELGTVISEKMHMQPILAEKWRWRILNEYPEDLKNVIRKWAMNEEIAEIEYNRISLGMIMRGMGLNILEASDLLYITSKDPVQVYEIFYRFVHRCRRK